MPVNNLKRDQISFLKKLGKKIENKILTELEYSSLDAFSLEHHDLVTKKTLYEVCKGHRDMKLSTLMNLANSLDLSLMDLLKDIKN